VIRGAATSWPSIPADELLALLALDHVVNQVDLTAGRFQDVQLVHAEVVLSVIPVHRPLARSFKPGGTGGESASAHSQ